MRLIFQGDHCALAIRQVVPQDTGMYKVDLCVNRY